MTEQTIPTQLTEPLAKARDKFTRTISGTVLENMPEQGLQYWLKVLVCSDYVERQLIHHLEAIAQQWADGLYHRSVEADEMAQMLSQSLQAVNTEQELYKVLRQFRNQQMVRITWRDINGLAPVSYTHLTLPTISIV